MNKKMDKLKMKKEILELLPSIEDGALFFKSTKESVVLQIKELSEAIKEKYDSKIRTNIYFEVINDNKFRCSLFLGFGRFEYRGFHFISFEKKLDENFPVELFAFSDKKSFGVVNNMNDFKNILIDIIKSEKTEILILSNL